MRWSKRQLAQGTIWLRFSSKDALSNFRRWLSSQIFNFLIVIWNWSSWRSLFVEWWSFIIWSGCQGRFIFSNFWRWFLLWTSLLFEASFLVEIVVFILDLVLHTLINKVHVFHSVNHPDLLLSAFRLWFDMICLYIYLSGWTKLLCTHRLLNLIYFLTIEWPMMACTTPSALPASSAFAAEEKCGEVAVNCASASCAVELQVLVQDWLECGVSRWLTAAQ